MPNDAMSQPFSKANCFDLDLRSEAMQAVESNYQEHIEAINLVRSSCSELIVDSARLIVNALATGNTIFWCGNGGSAADFSIWQRNLSDVLEKISTTIHSSHDRYFSVDLCR